ncbi:enoyl-CoA hydratase/isomerase family protein [Pseudalkalibacillus decolorationis]|uniref:enoyl-CoA hydratase/isomerase family protein n=1 Tax=Pseudalkalibacillus decolorationis TaxID=163879 RepID=UPI0021495BF2|nr:enoyl-CoA hydratase/isomerase family protein [Pseudalkalibacillus decolorationis]
MVYNTLLYQVKDGVLTVTINRPKTYNALSTETKLELADAFKAADNDQNVRAIVITGAGNKAFCSGQDLNESQNVDEDTARKWVDEFDQLYRVIRSIKKPIIASVNGFSTGSGLQLALLADIRISSDEAKYGMTEIDVGLACIIGTTMFWEIMGKSRTTDMILTGKLISAEVAEKYGLVTRVVPSMNLKEETDKLATELAQKPPIALASNKEWFKSLSDENFNSCMIFATEAHTRGYGAGEPQRMMEAFFEKRKTI